MCKDRENTDESQQQYRKLFGIKDKYLIGVEYDDRKASAGECDGYIVFIDDQNDLDYIDTRSGIDTDQKKQITAAIAKLQKAEAAHTRHLPEEHQLEFKRTLGAGYILALNCQFEGIDEIIGSANDYLKKRDREYTRELFLRSGLPLVLISAISGLSLYIFTTYRDAWVFGILFGILGAFVSIWTRYGKEVFTGHAHNVLHYLECTSRILIGSIFAVIAMIGIRCHLLLPELEGSDLLYACSIASFIAGFSERFIPSIIERVTDDSDSSNQNEI